MISLNIKNESKIQQNRNKQSETSTWFELFWVGKSWDFVTSIHHFSSHMNSAWWERSDCVCVCLFCLFLSLLPYLWMVLFIVNFLILASSKEMSHHETGITWRKKKRTKRDAQLKYQKDTYRKTEEKKQTVHAIYVWHWTKKWHFLCKITSIKHSVAFM